MGSGLEIQIEESLVTLEKEVSQAVVNNPTNIPQRLEEGVKLCEAVPVDVISDQASMEDDMSLDGKDPLLESKTRQVLSNERVQWRKEKVLSTLVNGIVLEERDKEELRQMLSEYHDVFSLEENERGETDLIKFTIDILERRNL